MVRSAEVARRRRWGPNEVSFCSWRPGKGRRMTTDMDLAGLEEAVKKAIARLGKLSAENAKLEKQLAAAKKSKSAKKASKPEAGAAEVRERLERLEQDLEGLLPS